MVVPKVSQVLLEARLKKKIKLEKAAGDLKIQLKFLEAFETGNFKVFTDKVQLVGFLKNYAAYLGLSPQTVLAFYRRDFGSVPDFLLQPSLARRGFVITPQKATLFSTLALLAVFTLFLAFKYLNFVQPPFLSLESPTAADVLVKALQIEARGQTCADCALTINGQTVNLSAEGRFLVNVSLASGANQLVVVATARSGRETKIVRNVIVEE